MKTSMTSLLFVLLVGTSYGQMTLDYNGGNAQFQKVLDVPGKTVAELYPLVVRWVAKTYKNPDAATNSKIENEMVRGEGFESGAIKLASIVSADAKYTWQVDVKDGRLRFTVRDMVVVSTSGRFSFESYVYKKDGEERTANQAVNVKEGFTKTANLLYFTLESAIQSPEQKKDDW